MSRYAGNHVLHETGTGKCINVPVICVLVLQNTQWGHVSLKSINSMMFSVEFPLDMPHIRDCYTLYCH